MHRADGPLRRALFMGCLIIAGEAIFSLPFHVARFFRPTLLAAFGFSNTQLGAAMAVYGITAMLAYFPGGPLADRFEARKLLALSLWLTGLGGFYFATVPTVTAMGWLYGFWGVSTILLFWGALISATRAWGSADEQGRAYGILDGGRGLLAAVMASAAAVLFAMVFPDDAAAVSAAQRRHALQMVIYAYTAVTILAGGLVWLFVPPGRARGTAQHQLGSADMLRRVAQVMRLPAVWLQAIIVISAYVAYKGFDNYALFAHQGYGLDEVEAAAFTAKMQWLRPAAALGAGVVADRWRCSRVVMVCFALLLGADLYFAMATPVLSARWVLLVNVSISCVAMFGLRGVYFALFEEAAVPRMATGTAVGLVSVIGYTPDIFVGLVAGVLLDRSPGVVGHQHFFLFLAGFAALGLVATLLFQRLNTALGTAAQATEVVAVAPPDHQR